MTTTWNRSLKKSDYAGRKEYCDPDIRFLTVSLAVFHFVLDCCAT